MNRFIILLLAGVFFTSCNKNDQEQESATRMKYVDLHESEVKMGSTQRIDLNEDGINDFTFKTTLFGDPILKQDRLSFIAGSSAYSYLLGIDNTETTKRLEKGNLISQIPPIGFDWFEVAQAVLKEKVIPESSGIYWQGEWKDAAHQYLPVQISKNGSRYHGWIEVSMDMSNERMILHQGAISLEAGKDARAGY